jgi:acyl carrier protein
MTHSDVPSGTDAAQVLAAVVRILESVAARPHPGIGLETALDTLDGVDSLRLLETVALAEERFGVQVDTGGLDGLETVGDIVRLISRQLPR